MFHDSFLLKKTKAIAIIPARSGSKGLKDKNIMLLNGKPLIFYTIEAAKKSELFEIVHVSTDSQKYADIAESYGANEPFLRDSENSRDSSSSWDVVREVLKKYQDIGIKFDVCVLLQPTSPMRTANDIQAAYALFNKVGAKSLSSVTEVDHPIQWCFPLDESMSMRAFSQSPFRNCRRQELQKHFRENGSIYIVETENICNPNFDFYEQDCVAFLMDSPKSIDIDSFQDFLFAETLMKHQKEEQ